MKIKLKIKSEYGFFSENYHHLCIVESAPLSKVEVGRWVIFNIFFCLIIGFNHITPYVTRRYIIQATLAKLS